MIKSFKDIDEMKLATFKQSWTLGYHFAKQLIGQYPEFTEKNLAYLIKGSIYYYHKEKGDHLTHGMVQKYLKSEAFPTFYQKHLNDYLKENKSKTINKTDGLLKPGDWGE